MIKSSTSKIYEQMEEKYHIFNTNMKQNPHVQMVQNMYDKGGQGVSKAELRPLKAYPYFKRETNSLGGVTKTWPAAILTLEQNPLRRIWFYDQNCSLPSFCNITLFLLATCVLPASPNFGQAKHGQNDPSATVCQQSICCPICEHHFTHWTHPDISLCFRAGGRRLKKFRFSRICMSLW